METNTVSFVVVVESITEADADALLDDLLDWLRERGIAEVPVSIPGDVTASIGGGNG